MKKFLRRWSIALICATLIPVASAGAAPAPSPVTPAPPITSVLRSILVDYRRYAETLWTDVPTTPRTGYWGTGRADGGNEGIRAQANTALTYALLFSQGDHTVPIASRVEPALLYAAQTHISGPNKGSDGKQWGNSWQSAMWAANLGVAAHLVKAQLTPQTLEAVKRVVAFEADRFNGLPPADGKPGNTAAEENAWDLTVASAAVLLMPENPHVANWHETVLRYGFNTLSVEADKTSARVLDGRPVSQWVSTVQLFPDYTLENHHIFHPSYAMIGPATNAQAAVAYLLAGRPVPDALGYNVLPEWGMLKYITLPDGEWLYSQGLDWDLHDYGHAHYWAMLAMLHQQKVGTLLAERLITYARRRQLLNGDGRFVGASSPLGFAREAVQAERTAFTLLMYLHFPTPPQASEQDWQKMVASLEPVRQFKKAGFVVQRAPRGLLSFSWKNTLAALVSPQAESHPEAPYVTTPYRQSLTGDFKLEGDKAKLGPFKTPRFAVKTGKTGFYAAVDATINDGALRQEIAVATLDPGIMVYLDRVTAKKDLTVLLERSLPVAIENDEVSGRKRQVFHQDGAALVTAGDEKTLSLPGSWANVDGRLGFITSSNATIVYKATAKFNRAGARENLLLGAENTAHRAFKAGDVVAMRAALLLPDASVKQTTDLAKTFRVQQNSQENSLEFTGPDGNRHRLQLQQNGSLIWDSQVLKPQALARK